MHLSRLAAQKEFEFMKVHPRFIGLTLRFFMRIISLFLDLLDKIVIKWLWSL